MSRRRFNELIVAAVALVCTIAIWLMLCHFGPPLDYWAVLIPPLLLIFYLSWRFVSKTDGNKSVFPYSVLIALVSAFVVFLDLWF